MNYFKSFLLVLVAYAVSLTVFLIGKDDPETNEKQTVIATEQGEGKAMPETAGEGDLIVSDLADKSPKMGE